MEQTTQQNGTSTNATEHDQGSSPLSSPDASPNKKAARESATDDAPSNLPALRFNRERASPAQRKASGGGRLTAKALSRLLADVFDAEASLPTRRKLILGKLNDTPPDSRRRKEFLRGRSESPTPTRQWPSTRCLTRESTPRTSIQC
ncbi:hypothetical protein C8R44DRAFT_291969 [Mycena epipterygia]|nr:hypothetical protein C8R44DRAFT_291969 [Mycena epipterygia]